MNTIKILIAAALALVIGFVGGTVLAQRGASEANILFLDQQRVLLESEAGKSINAQLQKMSEEVNVELRTLQQQIEAEGQQLQADRANYSEDELNRRIQFLRNKAQGLEQLKQIRDAELQQARANAITELAETWEPISEDLFEEREGFVLLEAQAVLDSDESGDITDVLIAELDDKVSTIDVVKPDLQGQLIAQQQAQQQAAQARAQAAQQQQAPTAPAGNQ